MKIDQMNRRNFISVYKTFCFTLLCLGVLSILLSSCKKEDEAFDSQKACEATLGKRFAQAQGVNWEEIGGYYVATFHWPPLNAEAEAWFDASGEWQMAMYDFGENTDDIPPVMWDTLALYPDCPILNVRRYENHEGYFFWTVTLLRNGKPSRFTTDLKIQCPPSPEYVTPDSSVWPQGQFNVHP